MWNNIVGQYNEGNKGRVWKVTAFSYYSNLGKEDLLYDNHTKTWKRLNWAIRIFHMAHFQIAFLMANKRISHGIIFHISDFRFSTALYIWCVKMKIKKTDVTDDGLRPSCQPKGGRGAGGPPTAVILTIQRG